MFGRWVSVVRGGWSGDGAGVWERPWGREERRGGRKRTGEVWGFELEKSGRSWGFRFGWECLRASKLAEASAARFAL